MKDEWMDARPGDVVRQRAGESREDFFRRVEVVGKHQPGLCAFWWEVGERWGKARATIEANRIIYERIVLGIPDEDIGYARRWREVARDQRGIR